MKYAIGEILLVMVGTLLALQVNDWNEERKLKQLEIQTLKELNTSLKNNLVILNSNINRFSSGSKELEYALEELERNKPYTDSLANSLMNLYGYPTMIFDYSSYETFKNRGIDIISIKKIKGCSIVC